MVQADTHNISMRQLRKLATSEAEARRRFKKMHSANADGITMPVRNSRPWAQDGNAALTGKASKEQ